MLKLGARFYDRSGVVRALMAPGLALQALTTREPDLPQLEVAVAALSAVLAAEHPGNAGAGRASSLSPTAAHPVRCPAARPL